MNIAYVRVSTMEQNEQRQIDALKCRGIDRWFTEKVSGKDTNRPQLQAMLDFAREGDTIFVHDFSRLARSTSDLLRIVELLKRKKIHLVSNKENIDTATPTGKLMLTMIGAINEFERQNLLERQREGIAIARANGKYKGRCPVRVESQKWQSALEKYRTRQINKQQMARMLGISRPTLNRLLSRSTPEEPR
jgi:DNA invertase Pin-like site-specific DNA recombinase